MDIRTIWYTKIWPWMKKYWVIAINYIVVAIAVGMVWNKPEVGNVKWLLGGWLGFSVLVGLIKFVSVLFAPQPEPPRPIN